MKRDDDCVKKVTMKARESLRKTYKKSYYKVTSFLGRENVYGTLKIVLESADAFERLCARPTPTQFMRFGAAVVTNFLQNVAIGSGSDFFYFNTEWSKFCDEHITSFVSEILLENAKSSYYIPSAKSLQVRILEFEDDLKAGWIEKVAGRALNDTVGTSVDPYGEIFVNSAKFNEFFAKILRKKYAGKSLVLTQKHTTGTARISVSLDELIDALPSAQATSYVEYFRKCLAAGVNRSLLLYGPPGTGKSTMAKQICKELNLSSIRIRVEDLTAMDNDSFHAIAVILQPQCIILDDFDRGCADESLFEALAFLRKHVKLIVATANSRSQIDEALLRPGRFDELGSIKSLDESVIRKILGQHQDIFEDVKDWPIAFIEEYITRRKFQTHEEATHSMTELAERVRRLGQYNNDQETVNITAIKPKIKSNKAKLLKLHDVD